ncbi:membrane protein [Streptomyces purpurascens]
MRTVGSAYERRTRLRGRDFEDLTADTDEAGGLQASRRRPGAARLLGRQMRTSCCSRCALGFISIYAGMGKLCDPGLFDGGKRTPRSRGSTPCTPGKSPSPCANSPGARVGSGLVIAFAQVIVGVLTVLGCWQRVAAGHFGALLSAALLVTVSWKSVPAYETPTLIYLAAWSR